MLVKQIKFKLVAFSFWKSAFQSIKWLLLVFIFIVKSKVPMYIFHLPSGRTKIYQSMNIIIYLFWWIRLMKEVRQECGMEDTSSEEDDSTGLCPPPHPSPEKNPNFWFPTILCDFIIILGWMWTVMALTHCLFTCCRIWPEVQEAAV